VCGWGGGGGGGVGVLLEYIGSGQLLTQSMMVLLRKKRNWKHEVEKDDKKKEQKGEKGKFG